MKINALIERVKPEGEAFFKLRFEKSLRCILTLLASAVIGAFSGLAACMLFTVALWMIVRGGTHPSAASGLSFLPILIGLPFMGCGLVAYVVSALYFPRRFWLIVLLLSAIAIASFCLLVAHL